MCASVKPPLDEQVADRLSVCRAEAATAVCDVLSRATVFRCALNSIACMWYVGVP